MAASICLAFRRFCRGAQSRPRRLSRMAPRILYSAYVFSLTLCAGIEVVDGRDQADDAGGDQVVEADALRQALLNPPRDQAHLRQVLQDQPLPLVVGHLVGHRVGIHMLPLIAAASMRPTAPVRAAPASIRSSRRLAAGGFQVLRECAGRW